MTAIETVTLEVGDPRAAETEMGPMANDRQYAKVLEHFKAAREQGATIACGGEPISELGGYFVRPTVLTDLPPDARAITEEIFGPVLAVTTFSSEDDAVQRANDTPFGLAGSVTSRIEVPLNSAWPVSLLTGLGPSGVPP